MSYHFNKIEEKWQKYWAQNQTFKATNNTDKPKYYVLDMFPYPSGAGLHVGHPLGYIASDINSFLKPPTSFMAIVLNAIEQCQIGQIPNKVGARNSP